MYWNCKKNEFDLIMVLRWTNRLVFTKLLEVLHQVVVSQHFSPEEMLTPLYSFISLNSLIRSWAFLDHLAVARYSLMLEENFPLIFACDPSFLIPCNPFCFSWSWSRWSKRSLYFCNRAFSICTWNFEDSLLKAQI